MYCPRDLCDHCEAVDEHDRTHFFMVVKAPVRPQLEGFGAELDLNLPLQADMNKDHHFTGCLRRMPAGLPLWSIRYIPRGIFIAHAV